VTSVDSSTSAATNGAVLISFMSYLTTSPMLQSWAQFGGGHGGRVPPFLRRGGHNVPCPPHVFSLGFVFGEVSKIKVIFVTFCMKRFSC